MPPILTKSQIEKLEKNKSEGKTSDKVVSVKNFVEPDIEKFTELLPKPMKPLAKAFVKAGRLYDLSPAFLAAISAHETGLGTSDAFKRNNAMGVTGSAMTPRSFEEPEESIMLMAKILASPRGPYAKTSTIKDIGLVYSPPNAKNDPRNLNHFWVDGVTKFYNAFNTVA
jgi:hypothetical protein